MPRFIIIQKHFVFLFNIASIFPFLFAIGSCAFNHNIDGILIEFKFFEMFVDFFYQFFFAQIFLRTFAGSFGFRAVIIDMAFLRFGGYFQAAFSTSQISAKRKIVNMPSDYMLAWIENLLNFIK
ncbi:MAG: hypothetical protein Q8K92_08745 [Leadbetterella sp.]|nr:hypothetical protein [Leadbetterella sp.]